MNKTETLAAAAARDAGWKYRRLPDYWTHPNHATWDGTATELCEHYHIYVPEPVESDN